MTNKANDGDVIIPVQLTPQQMQVLSAAAWETGEPIDVFVLSVSTKTADALLNALAEDRVKIELRDDNGRVISTFPDDSNPKPDQSE